MLWEGKVSEGLGERERWREKGAAVEAAVSYDTEHQTGMDYANYRARNLQIGSGTIESACKQLVRARLKQAGMIWDASGAAAVAAVRAWLLRERWQEAIALRGVRRRSDQRKQPGQAEEAKQGTRQAAKQPSSGMVEQASNARQPELRADVLAQVQAELSEQRGKMAGGRRGASSANGR
ncbi:MAG: hypothetical protein M3R61_03045 [Chloroflexota bacterium]|nr:hypothetical protein [Chloroflexota bacterium]